MDRVACVDGVRAVVAVDPCDDVAAVVAVDPYPVLPYPDVRTDRAASYRIVDVPVVVVVRRVA